ncbi:MAG: glycerol-3-phosphate 1-O-acyltransferase PlsY [Chloroflexota bacterium]|nr:glycerol-3-phosphate 1-O-acyltransferase PlsY [Dehalococcoidia bacterium]MDW8254342.1 glycerol-3-phosphate 1-O-acyltransferase PlsY [Chloroflexota bacterium]
MNESLAVVLTVVLSYLAGSFPSGIVYGRLFRGVDVRYVGSGKTGATNVLRSLGPRLAVAVGVTDILKGMVPVVLALWLVGTPLGAVAAGFGAIAGHNWSIFLGFSGGRGVATSVGAFLPMAPLPAIIAVAAFVLVVVRTRYVSLGSVTAAVTALLAFLVTGLLGARYPSEYYVFTVAGALLLVIRHADNLARLRAGTERKLGEPASTVRTRAQ